MNKKQHYKLSALVLTIVSLVFAGCSSKPPKVEKIDTKMENANQVSGDTTVGVKDGYAVVQKKVVMSEELRVLQNDVYSLEDRVYGNRKYGSLGLYGVLKSCRADLADKKNGGDGKLIWTEPIDRVTDKEEEFKVGIDEKDKLVGVSEEFMRDRIERFRGYKKILEKREDEYQEKLDICKVELKSRKTE
jgi:hypothetical protein